MKAYQNRVGDIKSWLEEAKVRQGNTGLLSEDPSSLQTQLEENKVSIVFLMESDTFFDFDIMP